METQVLLQECVEQMERLIALIERSNTDTRKCLGGDMLLAFKEANMYQTNIAREMYTELLVLKQENENINM